MAELEDPAGLFDPLDEVAHSPVKNVVRVYRDRIAFCVNNECALYCRFCLRKRMVGDEEWSMKKRELGIALDWIRRTPEIRDVLLTGGDPLVFSDERLEWLLAELRQIRHVEIIRLGTRLPVTLPFRVTEALARMLERYHPIWVNTHFNHPRELTPEAAAACDLLLHAGIPVGNQSVLLRGVNDDLETMQALCEGLVRMRVRPYYCYQAQLLEGTAHFRVPIEKGIEHLQGPARPHQRLRDPAVPARHAVRQGSPRASLTCTAARATTWWSRASMAASGASTTRSIDEEHPATHGRDDGCSRAACCSRACSATCARPCSPASSARARRRTPTTRPSRSRICSTTCSPAARSRSRSCLSIRACSRQHGPAAAARAARQGRRDDGRASAPRRRSCSGGRPRR